MMALLTSSKKLILTHGPSYSPHCKYSESTVSRSKTHCPNCNSLQLFAPKVRVVRGLYERYATCGVCDHEVVISSTNADEYKEQQKGIRRANRRRNAAQRRARRSAG